MPELDDQTMQTYEVTCTSERSPGDAIDRVRETTTEMQAEDVPIDHQRTTVTERPDGDGPQIDVRFRAATQGVVGWHLCRARLPAGGIRRIEQSR